MARAASVSVPVRAELDMDDLVDVGRRIVSALENLLGNIAAQILATVDDARARSQLAALERPIDTVVSANPDTAAARGELGALEQPIDTVVSANPDTAAARGELGALEQPIDVPIVPHVDDAAAQKAKDTLAGISGGGGTAGLLAGAAAAAPQLAAAAGAAFALKGAFDGTLGSAAQFDSVLQQIGVQLGLSDEQLKRVAEKSIELGESTDFSTASAIDGAKAQLELAKAGLDLNGVLAGSRQALLLAEAGQIDQAKAAEIAGVAMSTFALQTKDAALVADTLVGGANASAASVDDMAEALKYAGPAFAATYRESLGAAEAFKQTSVAIAVLSQQGQKGSTAGTGLAQALSQIANPGEKAGKAIGSLNARLAEQRDAKGYTEALAAARAETLELAKTTLQDRIQKLNEALRSGDPGAFAQQLAAVKERAKEFDLLDLTKGISFDKATKDTAGFEQQLGTLSGAVKDSVGLFGLTAKQLADLETGAQNAAASKVLNGTIFVDSAGRIRPVLEQVKMLRPALGGLTDEAKLARLDTIFGAQGGRAFLALLSQTDEELQATTAAVTKSGQAAQLSAAINSGLGGSIANLKSQIETLGLRIGQALLPAAEAIAAWLVDALPRAVEIATTAFAWLSEHVFPRVAEVAQFIADEVVPVLLDVMRELGQIVQRVAAAIADRWDDIQKAISNVIKVLAAPIAGFMKVLESLGITTELIGDVIAIVWGAMRKVIESVARIVLGIIDNILGVLSGDWDRAWQGARDTVAAVWDGIKALVGAAVDVVIRVVTSMGTTIFNSVRQKWGEIVGEIGRAVGDIVSTIVGLPGRIARALAEFQSDVQDAGREALGKMLSAVIEGIGSVLGELGRLAGRAVAALGNLGSALISKGRELIDGLGDGIEAGWEAVRSLLAGVGRRLLDAVGDVSKTLYDKGRDVIAGIRSGISDSFAGLRELVDDIPGQVIRAIGNVSSTLYQKGQDVINGFLRGMREVLPDLNGLLDGVINKIKGILNDIPLIGRVVPNSAPPQQQGSFSINARPVEAASFDLSAVSSGGRTIVVNNYSSPVYDDTRELTRVLSNMQFGLGA